MNMAMYAMYVSRATTAGDVGSLSKLLGKKIRVRYSLARAKTGSLQTAVQEEGEHVKEGEQSQRAVQKLVIKVSFAGNGKPVEHVQSSVVHLQAAGVTEMQRRYERRKKMVLHVLAASSTRILSEANSCDASRLFQTILGRRCRAQMSEQAGEMFARDA